MFYFSLAIIFVVALLAAVFAPGVRAAARRNARRSHLTFAANSIAGGVHAHGVFGHLLADAVIGTRYLLVVFGSDTGHIALAGVGDVPLGICPDSTPTPTNDLSMPLAVRLLGATEGTERLVAAGVIAPGDWLVPAANGKVRSLPVADGTYYIIGRSVAAANTAADDVFEAVTCFPQQRVVA